MICKTADGQLQSLSKNFNYNRIEPLVENIRAYITGCKAASLLDIGAGGPNIAIPLARLVTRYLAVEQSEEEARLLRNVDLNIICGTFPMRMNETFDLVLSCHSVPETGLDLYSNFLGSAWRLVKVNGFLLVITFKGSRGDIARLREELTGSTLKNDPQFETIVQNLSQCGPVRIERINSYISSPYVTDIVTYISEAVFRTERERLAHSNRLQEILHMRYRLDGQYVFPLEHLFLSVRRKKR